MKYSKVDKKMQEAVSQLDDAVQVEGVTDNPSEMAKQDFLFQFIDHKTGHRSEPFTATWNSMAEILKVRQEGQKPDNDDYILLVAVLDEKQTHIPGTPLITVKTYLEIMGGQNNG